MRISESFQSRHPKLKLLSGALHSLVLRPSSGWPQLTSVVSFPILPSIPPLSVSNYLFFPNIHSTFTL